MPDRAAMRLPLPPRTVPAAFAGVFLAMAAPGFSAETAAANKPDPSDPVARIRDEGMNRSEVMATLLALTDLNGPRLTGSPGLRRAIEVGDEDPEATLCARSEERTSELQSH